MIYCIKVQKSSSFQFFSHCPSNKSLSFSFHYLHHCYTRWFTFFFWNLFQMLWIGVDNYSSVVRIKASTTLIRRLKMAKSRRNYSLLLCVGRWMVWESSHNNTCSSQMGSRLKLCRFWSLSCWWQFRQPYVCPRRRWALHRGRCHINLTAYRHGRCVRTSKTRPPHLFVQSLQENTNVIFPSSVCILWLQGNFFKEHHAMGPIKSSDLQKIITQIFVFFPLEEDD